MIVNRFFILIKQQFKWSYAPSSTIFEPSSSINAYPILIREQWPSDTVLEGKPKISDWTHIDLKSEKIFKGILLILPAHLNKEVIMIIVLINCKTMLENSLKIKLQPSALAFNIISLTVPNIIAVSNKTVS